MAQVLLRNIVKSYDNKVNIVKNINLEIRDKEFMVLVGPSGCGKSTTLRMIAGLEDITAGECVIGQKIVNDVPPKHRDIAMVFQNYALYPHMSVYDNMAFGLKLRNIPKSEIDRQVKVAAKILGITDYLDRQPKALSGGQRQRVALGRAIVRNPAVFLFDEPLSNLDAKMRVQMRTEISKLHKQLDTTMIYVTHDQIEAMTMGDRICVMKDGIIQQVDTPLNIYDNPANIFVAGFIGMPPTNFFNGKLVSVSGEVFFENSELKIKLPTKWNTTLDEKIGNQVILGLRPEHIGSEMAEKDSFKQSINAVIELVEPMGAENYLYLKFTDSENSNTFIARTDPHKYAKVGEKLSLNIAVSKAHIFDQSTELLII